MGLLNTKGQLQIQETILTVFIFIVLIMFGLIFFYRVQSASIVDDFNDFQKEKASIDFITLGDLPEFSCSAGGIKGNCIDAVKLLVFMKLNATKSFRDHYISTFGYANITFYQVYPKLETNKNRCTPNKPSDCGVWQVYLYQPKKITSKLIKDTPVSLYFPEKDTYIIGNLVVEGYNV